MNNNYEQNDQSLQQPVQQPVMDQNNNYNNMTPVGDNNKKLPIKQILIGVAAAAVIGVVVFLVYSFLFKEKDNSYLILLDENKLIPFEENEKYGFIDTKGKVVIQPQYDKVGEFYDGHAYVMNYGEDKYTGVISIIDEKGKVKLQTLPTSIYTTDVAYNPEDKTWVVQGKLYNNKFKLISPETYLVSYEDGIYSYYDSAKNEYGIMTASGKSIYAYKAVGSQTVDFKSSEVVEELEEQYCIINVSSDDSEKYGIINCKNGKEIVPLDNKYISSEDNNVFEIYNGEKSYTSDEETVLYVQGDKIAYKTDALEGDVTLKYYEGGYLKIYDYTKSYSERTSYYIIATGTTVKDEPSTEDNLTEWEKQSGYTSFECSNGYGLMSEDKVAVSCEWEDIEYLGTDVYKFVSKKAKKDVILVEKNDKTSVYDMKKNEILFTVNDTYITDYAYSTFVKGTDEDTDEIVVYNLVTGKYQNFASDLKVTVGTNYITVKDDTSIKYYNTKLEHIYTTNVEKNK